MRAEAAAVPPGRILPITIIVPVRRPWSWWLRLSWPVANRCRAVKGKLRALGFIHIAHWGLVDRLPASAPRGRAAPLPTPYVLFHTNYTGDGPDYIETFAFEVPGRIVGLWGGAYDFPGPRPPSRFVDFVLRRALEGPHQANPYHYYAAYPLGTVRTVGAALQLRERLEALERQVRGLGPHELADAWQAFVTREQLKL